LLQGRLDRGEPLLQRPRVAQGALARMLVPQLGEGRGLAFDGGALAALGLCQGPAVADEMAKPGLRRIARLVRPDRGRGLPQPAGQRGQDAVEIVELGLDTGQVAPAGGIAAGLAKDLDDAIGSTGQGVIDGDGVEVPLRDGMVRRRAAAAPGAPTVAPFLSAY
jgi:hypothetical protein